MTDLRRKLKRIFSKRARKETKKKLEEIDINAIILGNRANKKPLHYFSSESIQTPGSVARAQKTYPNKVIQGEYLELDPEIMEVAFSHQPKLTKKGLAGSRVHTSLKDMNEAQEWVGWWEEQQCVELLEEADKITPVETNNLTQKYERF